MGYAYDKASPSMGFVREVATRRPSRAPEEEGETTLLSVVRHMSPRPDDKGCLADTSTRKTPFGMVRVPSGTHKNHTPPDNDRLPSYSLLPPVRQRTRYGHASLNEKGVLSIGNDANGEVLVFDTRTSTCRVYRREGSVNGTAQETDLAALQARAIRWLRRYMRKVVSCTFRLHNGKDHICTVYANGSMPDYQVVYHHRLHALNTTKTSIVRISRETRTVTVWVTLEGEGDRGHTITSCIRAVTVPLQLFASLGMTAILYELLTRSETRLVRQTLALCEQVDSMYATVLRPH